MATAKKVLILGGGLSGFYIARGLEKKMSADEVNVTLVDMRSGLVYQPFLAEVAGSAIEARHIQVPFSMHLKRTGIVQAKVTAISTEHRLVQAQTLAGDRLDLPYDELVVALGAVTRTLPIAGIAKNAVGLKTIEEAVYLRDSLMRNIRTAACLPKGSAERARLLTFVCVGGGFSGMEGFAEMLDLARRMCRKDPRLDERELNFHLVEAADRVFPELTVRQSGKAVAHLEKLGAHIHLSTFVTSAENGLVETSDGTERAAGLILWTAGVMANPVLKNSDLPLDERGRITCGADLRVQREGTPVAGVWALGDCSQVPDLTGHGLPDGSCAPTAQHSMRQSGVLLGNLVTRLRGESTGTCGPSRQYRHENAGMVAGLGTSYGAFTSGALTKGGLKIRFNGWLAWMAHRVYHSLAVPAAERRVRIWGDWSAGLFMGRDTAETGEVCRPRAFFEEFAAPTDR